MVKEKLRSVPKCAMPISRASVVKRGENWVARRKLLVGGAPVRNEVRVENRQSTHEEQKHKNERANHDRGHNVAVRLKRRHFVHFKYFMFDFKCHAKKNRTKNIKISSVFRLNFFFAKKPFP